MVSERGVVFMIHRLMYLTVLLLGVCVETVAAESDEPAKQTNTERSKQPNIVWISCEDLSPLMGCYGDRLSRTPHLDALAAEGIRFTHAFSCHGVCAPSRTGIITGMSPIGLGANHMRSKVSLPSHIQLFPTYLRNAGYFCTNNSKTDYNLNWKQRDVWDQSSNQAHWKNRKHPDQPFFAVFNFTMTHESKVWEDGWNEVVAGRDVKMLTDPAQVTVPPLYPDTPKVRGDIARLYDLANVLDENVRRVLDELKQAGELENTIVFFWSDHGNGLPRAKRWLYDSGTRVPLIVWFPEQLRPDGVDRGSVDHRLVNLLDLGPTVLSLAGVTVPSNMEGRPIFGEDSGEVRQYIFGARDRIDERFDLVRSVRNSRFRYVRNLMPWRPALQHKSYAERNATRQEMRRLLGTNNLPPEIAQFFTAPRPSEELYDLTSDPWELKNLVAAPEHQQVLNELRAQCDRWQIDVRDAHLIPESILAEEETKSGSRWQILHSDGGEQRVSRLLLLAKQVASTHEVTSHDTMAEEFKSLLHDQDKAIRWWAAMGLRRLNQNHRHAADLEQLLTDSSAAVRIVAAAGLHPSDKDSPGFTVLNESLGSGNSFERHAAILEIDESNRQLIPLLRDRIISMEKDEYSDRLAEHALTP